MKKHAEPLKHSNHFRAFQVKFSDTNDRFLPMCGGANVSDSVTDEGEATEYNVCVTNKMCVYDEEQQICVFSFSGK